MMAMTPEEQRRQDHLHAMERFWLGLAAIGLGGLIVAVALLVWVRS